MPELEPDVRAYYERGEEIHRLSGGFRSGPLELARTQEIMLRRLPAPGIEVLDVGGGPGVYAAWLASRGDSVHVVDPIPLHVDQASSVHERVTAEVGDARQLSQADASFDAVLLMGPLYHLVARTDRLLALSEARRVLRPGGLLFAAGISRFAALIDLLVVDRLHEPDVLRVVEVVVETGVFKSADGSLFTTAYFHRPAELMEEVDEAGFVDASIVNIEGPGAFVRDLDGRWADPSRRDVLLRAARMVESERDMLAAASHLLVLARAPGSRRVQFVRGPTR